MFFIVFHSRIVILLYIQVNEMIAKLKQFYQDLQYAPIQLFAKIKETNQLSLKSYYRFVLVIRSILLVGFSIIFISLFEMLFSNDNASLSVLIFV